MTWLTVTGNKPAPSLSRGRRKRNTAYELFPKPPRFRDRRNIIPEPKMVKNG
jgi:hypothetical protein